MTNPLATSSLGPCTEHSYKAMRVGGERQVSGNNHGYNSGTGID